MSSGFGYYLVGSVNGEVALLGPHNNEQEAYELGVNSDFDNGQFEIKRYATRDRAKATQMYKYELAKNTGKIGMSLKPIRHGTQSNKQKGEL